MREGRERKRKTSGDEYTKKKGERKKCAERMIARA